MIPVLNEMLMFVNICPVREDLVKVY